jgi:hypothetical protein
VALGRVQTTLPVIAEQVSLHVAMISSTLLATLISLLLSATWLG